MKGNEVGGGKILHDIAGEDLMSICFFTHVIDDLGS